MYYQVGWGKPQSSVSIVFPTPLVSSVFVFSPWCSVKTHISIMRQTWNVSTSHMGKSPNESWGLPCPYVCGLSHIVLMISYEWPVSVLSRHSPPPIRSVWMVFPSLFLFNGNVLIWSVYKNSNILVGSDYKNHNTLVRFDYKNCNIPKCSALYTIYYTLYTL